MFSRRRPTRDVLRLLRTGERGRVTFLHRLRQADQPVRRARRSSIRAASLWGTTAALRHAGRADTGLRAGRCATDTRNPDE